MLANGLVLPNSGERLVCSRVPEGMEGFVLAKYLKEYPNRNFLYVVQNESRMIQVQDVLEFTEVSQQVLTFPAWDCLPYDRVSPRSEIMSQRMKALSSLQSNKAGVCLLTTARSLLQKVPPKSVLENRQRLIQVGQSVDLGALQAFLVDNGYSRVATVREPGEYSIRGGIVDLYPAGENSPLRLDLFGEVLESLKTFDPVTQRSQQKRSLFALNVVGEVNLNPGCIERFRSNYRKTFGIEATADEVFQSVSSGISYPGMEHWLPLFYSGLETLFDQLDPQKTSVFLEHQIESALGHHIEQIQEYYLARQEGLKNKVLSTASPYRPLQPENLYLDLKGLQEKLYEYPILELTPFQGEGAKTDFSGQRLILTKEPGTELVNFDSLKATLDEWHKNNTAILLTCYSHTSQKHLIDVLKNHQIESIKTLKNWSELNSISGSAVGVVQLRLEQGFVSPDIAIVTEQDLLGQRQIRPTYPKTQAELFIKDLTALGLHDLVVHKEHGVGKYLGLVTVEADQVPHDCLSLEYAGGDKLFVPVENIDIVSLYGSEGTQAQLDRLGAASWQNRKAKVKERLELIADKLLQIASKREMRQGETFQVSEGLYQEFCARFPFHETDDQLQAIASAVDDLGSGKPMDRLICGDVGFGKTEVALRTAFVVASAGYQVAVVVPTTLLARQHFQNFKSRFQGFDFKLGQLSRMVSSTEKVKIKSGLASGEVNIVIGTHALLAKSVEFHKLGLVIIDEEQHFGVKQKERLKELKSEVHVLTLTATPIPRTLQMALTGVRDMSLIATPPVDRLAVRTFVMPFDGVVIKEAILREIDRGGQVFYVCPHLKDLPKIFEALVNLLPELRIATAHGQMPATQLEEVMLGFYGGQYQVLLSTNIVESGLDIPTANTIIIHRSDRFGLAQLYQLRGRVGRGKQRGYAYLLLPPYRLSENAQKRLEVMQTLDSLGAGFQLASHDMDIRGAGNLLGSEQSGHIREVGVELYQQMLEEAIELVRSQASSEPVEPKPADWTPQINLGLAVLIPDHYVEDLSERLALYRRISLLGTSEELEDFMDELEDRFGKPPEEVENLRQVIELKQLCRTSGVSKLDCGPKGAIISFHEDQFLNPTGLIQYVAKYPTRFKIKPDQRLVFVMSWSDAQHRIQGVKAFLNDLIKITHA